MGVGYSFECENCKEEYTSLLGVGQNELELKEKLIKNMKRGKYGNDFKEAVNLSRYAVVNINKSIYMCEKCGLWADNYDLELYVPKNVEEVKSLIYGEKTVKQLKYVPYIKDEDKDKFCLAKRIIYDCPNCKVACKKIEPIDFDKLTCLKCKSKLKNSGMIFWD